MAVVRSQGFAVEWAVVVYDGPQDLAPWVDVRVAAAILQVPLTLHRSEQPKGFHPKQVHQAHFRSMVDASRHTAIWLLDEDISFARTDMTALLAARGCAFE